MITGVCVLALALPVVATSSKFSDVKSTSKHAEAIAYVTNNGMLPPRSAEAFGPRYFVSDDDIVKAIRTFERMEDDRLRRDEFASFLLAGVQRVRNLNKPPTTTTTQPTTTIPNYRGPWSGSGTDIVRWEPPSSGLYSFTYTFRGSGKFVSYLKGKWDNLLLNELERKPGNYTYRVTKRVQVTRGTKYYFTFEHVSSDVSWRLVVTKLLD